MFFINTIKAYFAKRREYKRVTAYQRGTTYAMTQLDSVEPQYHAAVIRELEDRVDESRAFGDYTDFDRGIEQVLHDYERPRITHTINEPAKLENVC